MDSPRQWALHSLATLLSFVGNVALVVVSLDLEKALKLASPFVILENIIGTGIKGKLLPRLICQG